MSKLRCSEKGCRREAEWIWREYDTETAKCNDCLKDALWEFVSSRSVGEIEVLGPEGGRPGVISVN